MTNVIYQQDALGRVLRGTPLQWVHGGVLTSLMQLLVTVLAFTTVAVSVWREPHLIGDVLLWGVFSGVLLVQYLELRCRRVTLPVLVAKADDDDAQEDAEHRECRFIQRLQSSQSNLLTLGLVNLLAWLSTVSLWVSHWVEQRSDAWGLGLLWGLLLLLSVLLLAQSFQLFRRLRRLKTLSHERYSVTIQKERVKT